MPETTQFLPFHAINEFMRPDFRLAIIRETLTSQVTLSESLSNDLNQKIKKHISVPGFRNSEKAPALVKVLPTSKAFEKHPDLVAALLACWAEFHSELREQVYRLLRERNWKMLDEEDGINLDNLSLELIKEWPVLPLSVNRAKLPGFFTSWPKDNDFEILYKHYTEHHPDSPYSLDKVSLMAVWVSMRLPYQVAGLDETESPQ
jgi:hypothetical protein